MYSVRKGFGLSVSVFCSGLEVQEAKVITLNAIMLKSFLVMFLIFDVNFLPAKIKNVVFCLSKT